MAAIASCKLTSHTCDRVHARCKVKVAYCTVSILCSPSVNVVKFKLLNWQQSQRIHRALQGTPAFEPQQQVITFVVIVITCVFALKSPRYLPFPARAATTLAVWALPCLLMQ